MKQTSTTPTKNNHTLQIYQVVSSVYPHNSTIIEKKRKKYIIYDHSIGYSSIKIRLIPSPAYCLCRTIIHQTDTSE